MWDDIVRNLAKFPNGVLTSTDADGYPFSVRCMPQIDPSQKLGSGIDKFVRWLDTGYASVAALASQAMQIPTESDRRQEPPGEQRDQTQSERRA